MTDRQALMDIFEGLESVINMMARKLDNAGIKMTQEEKDFVDRQTKRIEEISL